MNRGDVILVRFPHPSGVRGKTKQIALWCRLGISQREHGPALLPESYGPTIGINSRPE